MKTSKALYGTICISGGMWTITYWAEKTSNPGSYTTGSLQGYGQFPYDDYPDLLIFDLTFADREKTLNSIILNEHSTIKESGKYINIFNQKYITLRERVNLYKFFGAKIINEHMADKIDKQPNKF